MLLFVFQYFMRQQWVVGSGAGNVLIVNVFRGGNRFSYHNNDDNQQQQQWQKHTRTLDNARIIHVLHARSTLTVFHFSPVDVRNNVNMKHQHQHQQHLKNRQLPELHMNDKKPHNPVGKHMVLFSYRTHIYFIHITSLTKSSSNFRIWSFFIPSIHPSLVRAISPLVSVNLPWLWRCTLFCY